MSNWDEEDYEPEVAAGAAKPSDKWDGEDEDDEIKDAWDDEEEDGEKKEGKPEGAAVAKKKKKSLKEIIAEKEGKKREEYEARKLKEEEERRRLTPEEIMAEKLRQQKIQEDADLELAKSAFGVDNQPKLGNTIDSFEPITKEDFDTFSNMIKDKLTPLERSTNYVGFLELLYRELAVSLEVEEVKRLSSCLTALYNEKNKASKSAKGKKKKGKSLNPGKDNNYDDYTAGAFDDMDDFM